jgi:fructan beta-fructosidase
MKKLLPSLRHIALPIISMVLVVLAIDAPQPACAQDLATPSSVELKITKHYLNIPIGRQDRMHIIDLHAGGKLQREWPLQLAEDTIGYWIYLDVSAFKGQKITLSGTVSRRALQRIYQDDQINGADSLYKESNRPQFHFTVKRGWNNDINGPIFYNGQYHLFWQSFPFGLIWNTGFMYWGHAVSTDLLHWQELDPALLNDSLGSPWSGTAVVDKNNDGGWGKNALVLYYACFDRVSEQEVQCIAYSTDGGKTFQHYSGNPVINSDWELGTTSTRDPKVFWYEPTRTWVMLLFEKDGMSFFNSTDMRHWTRESHVAGLWECPDFFELPVDGNSATKKWVIHGGSSEYMIGSFDGKTFTPETPKLRYAEGKNARGEDILYAAESFSNMPDDRVVQMAWGRIVHPGMPFIQMILFPTEFTLHNTDQGVRLRANPIGEIDHLYQTAHTWNDLTAQKANQQLAAIHPGPLHVKMTITLPTGNDLHLRYQGNAILDLAATDLRPGENEIEILLDKTVAEIFINKGERYIIHQLPPKTNDNGLEFDGEKYGPAIRSLQVYEMKSIWNDVH